MIIVNTFRHCHNTRQTIIYKIALCHNNVEQNILEYTGPNYWNEIVMKKYLEKSTPLRVFKEARILDG